MAGYLWAFLENVQIKIIKLEFEIVHRWKGWNKR